MASEREWAQLQAEKSSEGEEEKVEKDWQYKAANCGLFLYEGEEAGYDNTA